MCCYNWLFACTFSTHAREINLISGYTVHVKLVGSRNTMNICTKEVTRTIPQAERDTAARSLRNYYVFGSIFRPFNGSFFFSSISVFLKDLTVYYISFPFIGVSTRHFVTRHDSSNIWGSSFEYKNDRSDRKENRQFHAKEHAAMVRTKELSGSPQNLSESP